MNKTVKEVMEKVSHTFKNGVTVVNTTPHPLTFQDSQTMELVSIPSDESLVINAKVKEIEIRPHFVKSVFVSNKDGEIKINAIKTLLGEEVVIIGSMIAAQAYPGEVFGMTPVEGYERVAPSEKRMRDDKFVTYEEITDDKVYLDNAKEFLRRCIAEEDVFKSKDELTSAIVNIQNYTYTIVPGIYELESCLFYFSPQEIANYLSEAIPIVKEFIENAEQYREENKPNNSNK